MQYCKGHHAGRSVNMEVSRRALLRSAIGAALLPAMGAMAACGGGQAAGTSKPLDTKQAATVRYLTWWGTYSRGVTR
jgi:hypothetical protein